MAVAPRPVEFTQPMALRGGASPKHAHGAAVPCGVSATDDGGLRIALHQQQRGIAPGQSAVLYAPDAERGDRVLGQGTVRRAGEQDGSVTG